MVTTAPVENAFLFFYNVLFFIMNRTQLRRNMRQLRRSLPNYEIKQRSLRLTRLIKNLTIFRNSQRIAFYLSNDGEVDLQYLINYAIKYGKKCYLPILGKFRSRQLWFATYRPCERLRRNKLNINEPIQSPARWIRAKALDLILVPLVAFDINGNRLGRGGGYYDKTLSFLRYRHYWYKPYLVGIAYDFQCVPSIIPQPWDVSLNMVISELHIYRFK